MTKVRISTWNKDRISRVMAGETKIGNPWFEADLNEDSIIYSWLDGDLTQLVLNSGKVYLHPEDAIGIIQEEKKGWWHELFR